MTGALLAFILGWIARLVAGVAMIGAGAVAVGIVLVAKLSIGLALVFAPVLIPWGMWRPTEFLLTSWVRYLVSAAMQVVVAVAVGGLLMSVVSFLVAQVGDINNHEASIALSVAFIAFGLLSIYLMLQVPRLASGLISGDGTLGLDRWTVGATSMASTTAALPGKAASMATAPARAAAGAARTFVGAAIQGRGIIAGASAARAASRMGAGVVGAARAGMASYGGAVHAATAAVSGLTPGGAVATAAKAASKGKGGTFPRAPQPSSTGSTP
jgi:type IV secretory pathway VirB6-like protein